jgi:hypothetical protein
LEAAAVAVVADLTTGLEVAAALVVSYCLQIRRYQLLVTQLRLVRVAPVEQD